MPSLRPRVKNMDIIVPPPEYLSFLKWKEHKLWMKRTTQDKGKASILFPWTQSSSLFETLTGLLPKMHHERQKRHSAHFVSDSHILQNILAWND